MTKQPRRPNRRGAQQKRVSNPASAVVAPRGQMSREDLFASLRSGAANVAGVSYQIAVTALLLATGRACADSGPPVITVRPEGWEDVDCDLEGGVSLLVQTKERGPGARAIGLAELARIIAHAAPSLLGHGTADSDKPRPGRRGLPIRSGHERRLRQWPLCDRLVSDLIGGNDRVLDTVAIDQHRRLSSEGPGSLRDASRRRGGAHAADRDSDKLCGCHHRSPASWLEPSSGGGRCR